MDDTLYYEKEACFINAKAAEKIAGHLFVFCGYYPFPVPAISSDAKFMQSALELYKLIKDCSCIINKKIKSIMKENPGLNYGDLERFIDTVFFCRSVLAHNNNPALGPDYKKRIDDYNKWVKTVISADKPSSNDDYEKLFREIKDTASKIFEFVDKFIDAAEKSQDKAGIIDAWENEIFNWFGKNHDIFIGQLSGMYLIKAAGLPGRSMPNKISVRYRVCEWIKRFYFYEMDKKISDLNALFSVYSKKLNKKDLNSLAGKIEKLISEENAKRDKLQSEIASHCRKKPDDLEPFDYRDYFFNGLEDKLRDTFKKHRCSLLPEDLMQIMIDDYFKEVPID
jgi:hypothetical protein